MRVPQSDGRRVTGVRTSIDPGGRANGPGARPTLNEGAPTP